jgi:galactoside 2-L-fucosyltransferase 1/2
MVVVVKYIAGSTEMDMATIVECDHVIMTIGSYGWWCGWLAGGDVVYYKRAALPGSRFAKRINYEDHFYPGWVGFPCTLLILLIINLVTKKSVYSI